MGDVGKEVRRLREAKGWGQTKLAAAADMAVSGVSQIENGRRNPNSATLIKLAKALEVEVADLFPKGQTALFPEQSEQGPSEQQRKHPDWMADSFARVIDHLEEEVVRNEDLLSAEPAGERRGSKLVSNSAMFTRAIARICRGAGEAIEEAAAEDAFEADGAQRRAVMERLDGLAERANTISHRLEEWVLSVLEDGEALAAAREHKEHVLGPDPTYATKEEEEVPQEIFETQEQRVHDSA